MGTLVDICKKLKTLVLRLRILSFENIGNKTNTIQNSGSGDVVMGNKNITTNIHITPFQSFTLSEPAKELLRKIVEKGRVDSNIVFVRTDQADFARLDGKYNIEYKNIEAYLDELADAGMIRCLTNMRYILLPQGICFCENEIKNNIQEI